MKQSNHKAKAKRGTSGREEKKKSIFCHAGNMKKTMGKKKPSWGIRIPRKKKIGNLKPRGERD